MRRAIMEDERWKIIEENIRMTKEGQAIYKGRDKRNIGSENMTDQVDRDNKKIKR